MYAASRGYEGLCRYFLEHKADVNIATTVCLLARLPIQPSLRRAKMSGGHDLGLLRVWCNFGISSFVLRL